MKKTFNKKRASFSEEMMTLKDQVEKKLDLVEQKKSNWQNEVHELGEVAFSLKKKLKEENAEVTWEKFCNQFFKKNKNRINEAIADYRLQKNYSDIDFFQMASVNRVQLSQALNSKNQEKKKMAERLMENQFTEIAGEKIPLFDLSSRQLRVHLNPKSGEELDELDKEKEPDNEDDSDSKKIKPSKKPKKKIETIEDYKEKINETAVYFSKFGKEPRERQENVKHLIEIQRILDGLRERIRELLGCSKEKK